jgi:hypothetical protein
MDVKVGPKPEWPLWRSRSDKLPFSVILKFLRAFRLYIDNAFWTPVPLDIKHPKPVTVSMIYSATAYCANYFAAAAYDAD